MGSTTDCPLCLEFAVPLAGSIKGVEDEQLKGYSFLTVFHGIIVYIQLFKPYKYNDANDNIAWILSFALFSKIYTLNRDGYYITVIFGRCELDTR